MKVYCKNCKWYRAEYQGYVFLCFKNYKTRKITDPHMEFYENKKINEVISDYEVAQIRNKDNDCKDYKRKWWKFWIQQELVQLHFQ